MTALQRPGPCPRCDATVDWSVSMSGCIGVPAIGTTLREHYRCAIYRRWWDAGHAAGARSERAAQALDTEEAFGKEWV